MTTWSLADVARMRLISHGLIEPLGDPTDVVRHFGCTQGQDYPGSTTSIALRTESRQLADVRAAYDSGAIVRSWPMRGTLFVVPAEDLGWMLSLTSAKLLQQTARRRQQLDLTDDQLERAEEIVRGALSTPLTRAEMLQTFTDGGHDVSDGRGYHTLFHLAVRGVICQGPTEGKEQRWVLNDQWIGTPRDLSGDAAILEWLRRYVLSHGPVPPTEFHWWTKLLKGETKTALAALADEVAVIDVAGVPHWMAADLADRYASLRKRTPAPLLLPGFDEIVLGYGDRAAVLTKAEEALVVPGGNGMFKPTLIHQGRAIGTWKRPTRKNTPVSVEPFGSIPASVDKALPRLTAGLPG